MQLTDPERLALTDFFNAHTGEPTLSTLRLAVESIFTGDQQEVLLRFIANRSNTANMGEMNSSAAHRFMKEIALCGEAKNLHLSINKKGGAERLSIWMRDGQQAQLSIRHNQGTFSRAGIAEGWDVKSGILRTGDVLFIEYWQNGLQAYALLKYTGSPGNVTILHSEGFLFTTYAIKLRDPKEG